MAQERIDHSLILCYGPLLWVPHNHTHTPQTASHTDIHRHTHTHFLSLSLLLSLFLPLLLSTHIISLSPPSGAVLWRSASPGVWPRVWGLLQRPAPGLDLCWCHPQLCAWLPVPARLGAGRRGPVRARQHVPLPERRADVPAWQHRPEQLQHVVGFTGFIMM